MTPTRLASSSTQPQRGVVRTDTFANVRSGPGTQYGTVRQIRNGVVVTIYEEQATSHSRFNLWYRIDSQTGPWIWSGLVNLTSLDRELSDTGSRDRQTIQFQNGRYPLTKYQGAQETLLSEAEPFTVNSSAACLVDGDDPPRSGHDKTTLFYWDVSAMPHGAQVHEATITLEVFDETEDSYQLYELLRSWNGTKASWGRPANGESWHRPGAFGTRDRNSTTLGTLAGAGTGPAVITLNRAGRALVESWINDTKSNYGFAFANRSATDGIDFYCSTSSVIRRRPMLTVVYE